MKIVNNKKVRVSRISLGLFDEIEAERKRMQREQGKNIFFSEASESFRKKAKRKELRF